jgi:hypothetical protein
VWHDGAAHLRMKGPEETMGNNVVATIVRKTDEGPAGQRHIVVRASALPGDTAITVSRDDYDHLQPGMLVTVFHVGWGPLSAWWLRS